MSKAQVKTEGASIFLGIHVEDGNVLLIIEYLSIKYKELEEENILKDL